MQAWKSLGLFQCLLLLQFWMQVMLALPVGGCWAGPTPAGLQTGVTLLQLPPGPAVIQYLQLLRVWPILNPAPPGYLACSCLKLVM
jgi:hypothetical protein